MNKEKRLMTSLMISNFADISSTTLGLSMGFKEIGIAGNHLTESGEITNAAMLRTAVISIYIGLYALSQVNRNKFKYNYPFVFEKSIKIANLLSWGVAVLNTAQVAHHIFTK